MGAERGKETDRQVEGVGRGDRQTETEGRQQERIPAETFNNSHRCMMRIVQSLISDDLFSSSYSIKF